jgi:acyl-CoA reductase-like NAD-dependent aldehyde dehydrogenase
VRGLVDDAIANGARIIVGFPRTLGPTLIVEPMLLDDVPLYARIAREETFGPVISVWHVSTVDEAVTFHNSLPGGLDSSVFTRDLGMAQSIARRLNTGSVTVNDFPKHGLGAFPYQGWGVSGYGSEGIGYSVVEMTRRKTVVTTQPSNTPSE